MLQKAGDKENTGLLQHKHKNQKEKGVHHNTAQ